MPRSRADSTLPNYRSVIDDGRVSPVSYASPTQVDHLSTPVTSYCLTCRRLYELVREGGLDGAWRCPEGHNPTAAPVQLRQRISDSPPARTAYKFR